MVTSILYIIIISYTDMPAGAPVPLLLLRVYYINIY
jgi:hypothetical protein